MVTIDNRIVEKGKEFYVRIANENDSSRFEETARSLGYKMILRHNMLPSGAYPYFFSMYVDKQGAKKAI